MAHNHLLDTAKAAERLCISPSTLEKLRVYGGGARYLKLGRTVRYRAEDLDQWLESRLVQSTSETPRP
jgi:excisionase family DNA binding protein